MATNKALGEAIGTVLALVLGFLMISPAYEAIKQLTAPFLGIHIQIFTMGVYFSMVNIIDAPLVILYWILIALIVGLIAGKRWGGAVTAFSVWGTMLIFGIVSISFVLSNLLALKPENYLQIIPDDFSLLNLMTLPLMDELFTFIQEAVNVLISTGGRITFQAFFAFVWVFFKVYGLNLLMIMVIVIGFGFFGGWLNERFIAPRREKKDEAYVPPPPPSFEDLDFQRDPSSPYSEWSDEEEEEEEDEYPSWDDYLSKTKQLHASSKIYSFTIIGLIITSMLFGAVAMGGFTTNNSVCLPDSHFENSFDPLYSTSSPLDRKPTIHEFISKLAVPIPASPKLTPSVSSLFWENISYSINDNGMISTYASFEGTNPVFSDMSLEAIKESSLIMLLFSKGDIPLDKNPFYFLLGDAAAFLSDLTLIVVYPTTSQKAYRTHEKWGNEVASLVNDKFDFNLRLMLHGALLAGNDILLYGDDGLSLGDFLTEVKTCLLDDQGLAELINPMEITKRNGTIGTVFMKLSGYLISFRIPAITINTIEYDALIGSGNFRFDVFDYEGYTKAFLAKNPNASQSTISVVLPEGSSAPSDYQPTEGYYNTTTNKFIVNLDDPILFPSGTVSDIWVDFNADFPIDLDISRQIIGPTEIKVGERITVKLTIINKDSTETATNVEVRDDFGKVYGSEANIITLDPPAQRGPGGELNATYPTIAPGETKEIIYTVELQKPGRFILPHPWVNYTTPYLAGKHADFAGKDSVLVKYTVGEWILRFLESYWFMLVIVFIFAMIDFLYWLAKERR